MDKTRIALDVDTKDYSVFNELCVGHNKDPISYLEFSVNRVIHDFIKEADMTEAYEADCCRVCGRWACAIHRNDNMFSTGVSEK